MGLEEHLANLVADGEFVETADFTLNTMKAAQKLSEYQLPSPALWVAKLVQAAVAYGSPWCRFSSKGRILKCRFQVSMTLTEAERLLHKLLSAQLVSESGPYHLLAAIRGSVHGPTQRWSWTVIGPDIRFGVECDERGIRPIEEFDEDTPEKTVLEFITERPLAFPSLRKALGLPVKYLMRQIGDEYLTLVSHCWLSPATVSMDASQINGQFRPPSELGEDSWKEASKHVAFGTFVPSLTNYVLVRKELPLLQDGLKLEHPWIHQVEEAEVVDVDARVKKQDLTFLHEAWLDWKQPPGTEVGGQLLLLLGSPLPSQIDWVCDGVLIDSSPLPWSALQTSFFSLKRISADAHLSLRILLPVSVDQLDLSQFRVRNPEEKLDAMLSHLRQETLATGELVQAFLKKLKLVGQKRPRLQLFTKLMYNTVTMYGPVRAMVKWQLKNLLESLDEAQGPTD